ncbi:unnamed protein product [Lactuca virosa]|uniref:O-methyltransferase dimerisation domain-containing protein n=1 Tax=Lactuca virosa TaxID=75947 RepID=A0AAU9MAR2_9ASTR|nr:unnamed protein product [Lactuca virosa]
MSNCPSRIHLNKREMELQHDEQSLDLLSSEAHIWNHIYSFINSMSLKCAIQLQIPDIINRHGAPMLLSELVEALSIKNEKTQYVFRLMGMLVHSGFFVKQSISTTEDNDDEETKGYLLAPASRYLLTEEPLSSRSLVLAMLDPILMDPWQSLLGFSMKSRSLNSSSTNQWPMIQGLL